MTTDELPAPRPAPSGYDIAMRFCMPPGHALTATAPGPAGRSPSHWPVKHFTKA
ncbi:hypothetical protein T261_1821 [Streptomyces lydicus]|nr:hypothetical protein T261_1821 [Streptomyces lydicus]